jgi:hypothetical protein
MSRPTAHNAIAYRPPSTSITDKLPAHEGAERLVGLARKPRYDRFERPRQQFSDALDHHLPVAQQIEERDRHDDQVHGPGDQREARARHASDYGGCDAACFLPVFLQHADQLLHVRNVDVQIELRAKPRHRRALEPGKPVGQVADERADLALQVRNQQQQDQEQEQRKRQEHDRNGGIAAQADPLQPLDDRIEQVGEHGGNRKRRQHRREQVDGEAYQQHKCEHLPARGDQRFSHAISPLRRATRSDGAP